VCLVHLIIYFMTKTKYFVTKIVLIQYRCYGAALDEKQRRGI